MTLKRCFRQLIITIKYLTFSENSDIIITETRKGVDALFNKMVEPSEEELTTLLGLSEQQPQT